MTQENITDLTANGRGGRKVKHVLLVDDNRDAAQALAKLLSQDGYEVNMAFDGDTALALAQDADPDAIILDINLPGKSGYEVARALRQRNSSALLIALTGYYGKTEDRLKAEAVGFDYHLTRPILVNEIEKLFERGAQQKKPRTLL